MPLTLTKNARNQQSTTYVIARPLITDSSYKANTINTSRLKIQYNKMDLCKLQNCLFFSFNFLKAEFESDICHPIQEFYRHH